MAQGMRWHSDSASGGAHQIRQETSKLTLIVSTQQQNKATRRKELPPPLPNLALFPDCCFPQLTPGMLEVTEYK